MNSTNTAPMLATISAPQPPRKPEPHECCGTGCIPCVMDIYEEELWQYEKDLKTWEAATVVTGTDTPAEDTSSTSA